MTPVFGHGRLRLYLLKLLDESPKHGYEIIQQLKERFAGLYAPSAGTVYPRLARLESEGLVRHVLDGGRKVYHITEAGQAELNRRGNELEALEAEIKASVNSLAEEIRNEVSESARQIRDELREAAQEAAREARPSFDAEHDDPRHEHDGPHSGAGGVGGAGGTDSGRGRGPRFPGIPGPFGGPGDWQRWGKEQGQAWRDWQQAWKDQWESVWKEQWKELWKEQRDQWKDEQDHARGERDTAREQFRAEREQFRAERDAAREQFRAEWQQEASAERDRQREHGKAGRDWAKDARMRWEQSWSHGGPWSGQFDELFSWFRDDLAETVRSAFDHASIDDEQIDKVRAVLERTARELHEIFHHADGE
jgi:DNA-binding PadR family transcriptional regulator